ncbi:MAG: hypothetical protein R2750_12555 [Bacteroidales bacterium]
MYTLESGKTSTLTEGMMGFDVAPLFSPDGNYMAWESMERDGYESDQNRLFILNLKTGDKTYATKGFDQNAGSLSWADDSQSIYHKRLARDIPRFIIMILQAETLLNSLRECTIINL